MYGTGSGEIPGKEPSWVFFNGLLRHAPTNRAFRSAPVYPGRSRDAAMRLGVVVREETAGNGRTGSAFLPAWALD